jgi:hypothetical protein
MLATAGLAAGYTNPITSAAIGHSVAVGDAIIVACYNSSTNSVTQVTDSAVGPQGQVNTYVKYGSGGSQNVELWYCINAWAALTSGVDTISVSWNATGAMSHFHAIAVLGANGIMANDIAFSAGSGTGPSFTRSTGTLAQASELVIGVCDVTNAGAGITWTAPMTTVANLHVGANIYSNTAYDVVSSTASVTAAGTVGGGSALTEGLGTFKGGTTAVGTGGIAAKKVALAGTGTYTDPVTGTGALAAKKAALAGTGTAPVTKTNSFEGGTDGTAISIGNSGGASGDPFDVVTIGTGDTVAYSAAQAEHGALSGVVTTPATAANGSIGWSAASLGSGLVQAWFRLYLYVPALQTSGSNRVVRFVSSPTTYQGGIGYNSAGKIITQSATGATQTTSAITLPPGQWHRLEGYLIGSPTAGQIEVRIFKGANVDGFTPDEVNTSPATVNTTGPFDTVTFGNPSSLASHTLYLDDLGVSTAGYIGPAIQSGGTGGLAAKKAALAGAGSYVAPVTGTGALAARKAALAGTGTYAAPGTGAGAWTAKKAALHGTGTTQTIGAGAWHAKKPALAGAGSYSPPFTGTGALAAKKAALHGTGTAVGAGAPVITTDSLPNAVMGQPYPPTPLIASGGSPPYSWVATGLPAGLVLTGNLISGTPATAGPFVIGVTCTDSASLTATASYPINIDVPPPWAAPAAPNLVPVMWGSYDLNPGDDPASGFCAVVTDISGWYGTPALDGHDLALSLADGAVYGTKTVGPRVVTIQGMADGPRDQCIDLSRQLAAMAAEKGTEVLAIGEADTDESAPVTLIAVVRADTNSLQHNWLNQTALTWQVDLTAADPRLYAQTVETAVMTTAASGGTGRAYPMAPPRHYASGTLPNDAALDNIGTVPAPVTITYNGPLAASQITDGTNTIFMQALVAGEQVTVNSETLAATAPGGATRASYIGAGSQPLLVPPGGTTWSLIAPSSAGSVQLAWQGAWV